MTEEKTEETKDNRCPQCFFDMVDITACHFRCPNCGHERACSVQASFTDKRKIITENKWFFFTMP